MSDEKIYEDLDDKWMWFIFILLIVLIIWIVCIIFPKDTNGVKKTFDELDIKANTNCMEYLVSLRIRMSGSFALLTATISTIIMLGFLYILNKSNYTTFEMDNYYILFLTILIMVVTFLASYKVYGCFYFRRLLV